ncbi:hypothetical protein V6Z12_D04G065900 [Gossypium hirsutum]
MFRTENIRNITNLKVVPGKPKTSKSRDKENSRNIIKANPSLTHCTGTQSTIIIISICLFQISKKKV